MRRLFCAVVLTVATFGALTTPSTGQTTTTTATTTTVAMADDGSVGQTKSVIPKPNSGSAPKQFGDRGAGGQFAVLLFILAALGTISFVVVRSTIRNGRLRDAGLENGNDPRRS